MFFATYDDLNEFKSKVNRHLSSVFSFFVVTPCHRNSRGKNIYIVILGQCYGHTNADIVSWQPPAVHVPPFYGANSQQR